MKVLSLKVRAPQVSFRRPLDINYQRTLPLPPPTTMIGLAGAALGLSEYQIWNEGKWENLREIKVAALLDKPFGKAKDMMTVLKIKSKKIEQRSPYFRELLFDVEYTLIYGGKDEIIEDLREAFQTPFFPLSLGREDELIEIKDIDTYEITKGSPTFFGTAIPGDIRKMDFKISDFGERSTLKIEPPIVENVPMKFKVAKGFRVPVSKGTITFLPYFLRLTIANFPHEIFSLNGKNFTWMNP